MIQAYFFDKSKFSEDDVKHFIIENNIGKLKISDNKYHYKIKLMSAKRLKQEGYNLIIQKLNDYQVCKASKPEINSLCKFTFI
jgi:hypothetical protein